MHTFVADARVASCLPHYADIVVCGTSWGTFAALLQVLLRRQLYILLLVFALRYPFLYTKQCVAALYGAFSSRMLFLLIIEAKLIVVNYSEH